MIDMTEQKKQGARSDIPARIGQYRIIRKIGSGGTGDVYLCRHIILDNCYALKVLHDSGDAAAQGRMLREARIARRIRHRNLVPVLV